VLACLPAVGAGIGPALDDISRGGLPLNPGVYDAGAADLTGTLTLNGPRLYIIRTTSLTTAAGPRASIVNLNGASPCDLWWTVASSAAIKSGSAMAGNILAHTSITIGTGASLQGRALAYTGNVTRANNVVTACSGGTAPGFLVMMIAPPTVPILPVGVPYSQQITASGGTAPITFSVVSGTLPAGLTLTAGGLLSGTPTTAGSSTITIRATDFNGLFTEITYTIVSASGIPTLSDWAMIMLAALLAIAGFAAMRRQR
jgi:Ice-binding-like/Putative Ig domain/IPTL-CTERM motif